MAKPNKGCKVKKCKLKHSSKGFCKKHYTAWWKGFILEDGTFLPHYNPRPVYTRCKYPQCGTPKIKGHGYCQKHYKRAQNNRIDWDTCKVLDKEWFKKKNYRFEKINGIEIALPLEKCKLSKCNNRDLKGRGLCTHHYGRVIAGFITENGDRLAKPLVRYRDDFKCAIASCGKTHKESRMTLGLCRYHYSRYKKGYIDYEGHVLKENKKVASYDGQVCAHYECKRRPRIRGFCTQHIEHFKKGYVDQKGRKLKEPKKFDNRGKTCKVAECQDPAHAKRLCQKHYNQLKDNGFIGNVFKNSGHQCSEEGCEKPAKCLTLCYMHYYRLRKYGQTEIPKDKYKNKHQQCSVESCYYNAKVGGMCNKHYSRMRTKGTTEGPKYANLGETCVAPDCDREAKTKKMCKLHYERFKKHGTFELVKKKTINANKFCKIDACDRVARAKGYCGMHYKRLTTTGSLNRQRPRHTNKICREIGCMETTKKLGYCSKHHYRNVEKPRNEKRRIENIVKQPETEKTESSVN